MTPALKQHIVDWQHRNGAFFGRPAGHALRALHEMVELCIAAGATPTEIIQRVSYEIVGTKSPLPRSFSEEETRKELADVAINVLAMDSYLGGMLEADIADKLIILNERQWVIDKDGVPWRSGRTPEEILK